MAKFQIRRSSPNDPISGVLPSVAMPIGLALQFITKDADSGLNTFTYANGHADGFLTKPIRVGAGLSADEIAFGLMTYDSSGTNLAGDGEILTPFEAGKPGTIEEALDLEVESPDNVLTSGSAAITTGTAVGTALSFEDGKFCVAQAAEMAEYRLVAQMTPEVAGCVRLFVSKIKGYLVPSE